MSQAAREPPPPTPWLSRSPAGPTTCAGPLEATINSLQNEIDSKGVQGRELQRRWIQHQTELVALQNENAALTEDVARLKAEHTVVGA